MIVAEFWVVWWCRCRKAYKPRRFWTRFRRINRRGTYLRWLFVWWCWQGCLASVCTWNHLERCRSRGRIEGCWTPGTRPEVSPISGKTQVPMDLHRDSGLILGLPTFRSSKTRMSCKNLFLEKKIVIIQSSIHFNYLN